MPSDPWCCRFDSGISITRPYSRQQCHRHTDLRPVNAHRKYGICLQAVQSKNRMIVNPNHAGTERLFWLNDVKRARCEMARFKASRVSGLTSSAAGHTVLRLSIHQNGLGSFLS